MQCTEPFYPCTDCTRTNIGPSEQCVRKHAESASQQPASSSVGTPLPGTRNSASWTNQSGNLNPAWMNDSQHHTHSAQTAFHLQNCRFFIVLEQNLTHRFQGCWWTSEIRKRFVFCSLPWAFIHDCFPACFACFCFGKSIVELAYACVSIHSFIHSINPCSKQLAT